MNKDEEEILIQSFKRKYSNFPEGILCRKDPPSTDYLLTTTENLKIGIELTEIFVDEKLKQVSSEKEKLTDSVLKKLSIILPFTFSINIDLDSKKPFEKRSKVKLVDQIVSLCVDEFYELSNYEHKRIENIDYNLNECEAEIKRRLLNGGYRNLPQGIKNISIHRYDSVAKSWNRQSEGGGVPRLTLDILNKTLTKKECKIQKYSKCDQLWLIIKEGNYFAGYFDDVNVNAPISTMFDKVFLFRTKNQEIIDLTLK